MLAHASPDNLVPTVVSVIGRRHQFERCLAQASNQLFARCVVRAFSFESCFARVLGGCCHCSSRAQRSSVSRRPGLPDAAATPAKTGSRESSSEKSLSWSIFALVLSALPWTTLLPRSLVLHTYGVENRGHSDRHASEDLSPDRVGLDTARANGRRASAQRRILGVVAETALTLQESRRVMSLTLDGDVYVEDAAGQGREIEGIRRSESRALSSGTRQELRIPTQARRRSTSPEVEARADFDRRHPGVPHLWRECGDRSRGFRGFRRNVVLPPWLLVAREVGLFW